MSDKRRLLVVDDERVMTDFLGDMLSERYDVSTTASLRTARDLMGTRDFDLVITDLQLEKDDSGMSLVDECRERGLPVVVMTAYASVDRAVEAMKRGAVDFLTKPFGGQEMEAVLRTALDGRRSGRRGLAEFSRLQTGPRRLVLGRSEAMRRVMEMVEAVATTRATVMLTGESGTGKEMVAAALHAMSRRAGGPFIKVNCAAITDTLLESTLFGHEKGAFTGAIKRTAGKFELANGGTLLLDEISEMKQELQSKLLRVLQEREFELVGGTTTLPVDVRIVATSNRNIKEEVRKGNFREDLYFRLNVVPVHVPPLRERREDIPDLTAHFIRLSAIENGVPEPQLPPALLAELMRLPWPGNVRQLQNTVERAVVLARGEQLALDDFLLEEEVLRAADAAPSFDQDMTLKEMEKRMILATLSRFRENRTQAARHLGISVRTLRNKLNLYRQQSRSATA
ncbi:MAG: sigma-54-dependent Fis family transcriptional regulator [Candidatus Krumholzibacteriota bacterium]|nr:sigma-54-dependent Fis family transcriptional regulator [Candidatus Krumholzibacteriota bacterium]